MLAFLRRRRGGAGRHSLGAAVTAIPAAPRRVPVDVLLPAVPAAAPALSPPQALPVAPAPAPPAALPPPELPQVGRVELGFRDGSSTVLEPTSEQAAALRELADLLGRSSGEPLRPTQRT